MDGCKSVIIEHCPKEDQPQEYAKFLNGMLGYVIEDMVHILGQEATKEILQNVTTMLQEETLVSEH